VFLALLVYICTLVASISSPVENSACKTSLHLANWHRFCHRASPIHQITLRTCLRFRYFSMRSFSFPLHHEAGGYRICERSVDLRCFAHCIALSIAYSISSSFGFTCTYLARLRCGSLRSAQPLSTSVPKKSLWLAVHCPHCQSTDVKKHGVSSNGKRRYRCLSLECPPSTFSLNLDYPGRIPEVKQQIVEITLNGSGVRYLSCATCR